MPKAVTEQSTLTCAHQGAVQAMPSQTLLTVGGAKVLVDGDLVGATVSPACATVPDPNTATVKCTATTSALGGLATQLTVGGKSVVLEPVNGLTNGTVSGTPQTWSVQDAGQTLLTAI